MMSGVNLLICLNDRTVFKNVGWHYSNVGSISTHHKQEVTLSQHYYTQSLILASLRQDEREELERRNPKSLVDAIVEAVSILATRQVD